MVESLSESQRSTMIQFNKKMPDPCSNAKYKLDNIASANVQKIAMIKNISNAPPFWQHSHKSRKEALTMDEKQEILTREEVMDILKICRSTFYKLMQEGKLKGYKDGNRYKVPVYSVEEYIKHRMDS